LLLRDRIYFSANTGITHSWPLQFFLLFYLQLAAINALA
jgi:hypothetical protein